MPIAPIAAAAAPLVGGLIGKAIGPKQGTTTPQLPNDLTQSRGDTLGLMRYLLGFGGQNPTAGANGTTQSPLGGTNGPAPQPFGRPPVSMGGENPLQGMIPMPQPIAGGMGGGPGTRGYGESQFRAMEDAQTQGMQASDGGARWASQQGGQGGMTPMPQGMAGGQGGGNGFSNPASPQGNRINSVFGNTGVGATPLQRQSSGGISQFINQPSPETRTMDNLQPGLMSMFGQQLGGGSQNPLGEQGQGVLSGLMGGANPMPQNAQNTLGGHLNADLLGGGLRDPLTQMGKGGGLPSQLQDLMTSGGAGADTSAIRAELGQNPGAQHAAALQPHFEQRLALANQSGGRFGTANAYGRSQAVNDFNLLQSQAVQQDLQRRAGLANSLAAATGSSAANQNATRLGAGGLGQSGQLGALNALLSGGQASAGIQQGAAGLLGQAGQQGIGNQLGATQLQGGFGQQGIQNQQGWQGLQQNGMLGAGGLMGQLAGQSGQNDFQRLLQSFGVGTQQAQQNDVETQRNLGILMNMFGSMQQATLGAPVSTSPTGAQQGSALGSSIGQILAMLNPQKPNNLGAPPNNLGL
jgi:hypothetical protein